MIGFATTFALGAVAVFGLSALLWAMGREAGRCPVSGQAARAATMALIGGFVPLALGLILVIAAWVNGRGDLTVQEGATAVGFAWIAGGVGFTLAATTLRDTLRQVRLDAYEAAAEPVATPPEAA